MQTTEELLDAELFNKIPKDANIAIYGANNISSKIFRDIILKRNDVKIDCFIEKQKRDNFENREVCSLKEFLEKKIGIDLVVITVSHDIVAKNILDVNNITLLPVADFIMDFYEGRHEILNDENYREVVNIFSQEEDKVLFDMIFRLRKRIDDDSYIRQYYFNNYSNKVFADRTIKYQYLEKINKENVHTIIDLGFNSGFNAIAYDKMLPNLKMIYAFEAIYDLCKNSFIEDFIAKDKLTLIKSAVGNSVSKTKFYVNNLNPNASMINFSNSIKDKNITDLTHKIIDVDVTTIDDYCSLNNIAPDFIKMDIEGAELPAIIGGMKTITKYRPQMAISIYHCDKDFIDIPKYLYSNLQNYTYKLGHYSPDINETVLYALPA